MTPTPKIFRPALQGKLVEDIQLIYIVVAQMLQLDVFGRSSFRP